MVQRQHRRSSRTHEREPVQDRDQHSAVRPLGALPRLEAARQHLDVRESLLLILVRPPGRRGLLWSSTVEDDLPIARQLRFACLELNEIDRAFDVE